MDSTSRWTVTIHGSVYTIGLARPTGAAEESGLHLPTSGMIAEWLDSVSQRREVAALYAAAFGEPAGGFAALPRRDVARRLADAFRDRRLVCLRAGSYRLPVYPLPWPEVEEPPPPSSPPPPERPRAKATTWLAVELVDDRGRPVAGELCRIVLPDGTRREQRLDARGLFVVEDIEPGTCEVTFPEIDEREWEPA